MQLTSGERQDRSPLWRCSDGYAYRSGRRALFVVTICRWQLAGSSTAQDWTHAALCALGGRCVALRAASGTLCAAVRDWGFGTCKQGVGMLNSVRTRRQVQPELPACSTILQNVKSWVGARGVPEGNRVRPQRHWAVAAHLWNIWSIAPVHCPLVSPLWGDSTSAISSGYPPGTQACSLVLQGRCMRGAFSQADSLVVWIRC